MTLIDNVHERYDAIAWPKQLRNHSHSLVIPYSVLTMLRRHPGGGVLPIMDYTGRLRPKVVPFQSGGIYKGRDFTS